MYPLTEAAELLDLGLTPMGELAVYADYECGGSKPNSRSYLVISTSHIARGFVAEVCGCKVSAHFKQPITIATTATYEDGEVEVRRAYRDAFMAEVAKHWPGVVAHLS